MLEDEEGAIRFYQAALSQEGLTVDEELRVARRLGELLGRADRHPERLVVLERLARLDPNVSSRRTVIGEAARLAESLGETDRALALWKSRVDTDEDDLFALDAMIALLENSERWEPLIEMLGHRVSKTRSEIQRRADLTRIAGIYDRSLNAPDRAIAAWLRVQHESGESAETVDALADLYTRTERWNELADVLERASGRETVRVTDRLVRLADAHRAHLDAPTRALAG
jgi:tetratricopeptide (TPR) repeat protein